MKLWLQVLFAQGYLWRDRFPEAFADTRIKGPVLGSWVLIAVALIGWGLVIVLTGSALWLGVVTLVVGVLWVLWRGTSILLRRPFGGRRHLLISLHWATAFIIFVLLWFLVFGALLRGAWVLAIVCLALQVDNGSAWLWEIQNNYLLFRDPSKNHWRVDAHARTGLVSPSATIARLVEAYILLPAEILGLRRAGTSVGGDA